MNFPCAVASVRSAERIRNCKTSVAFPIGTARFVYCARQSTALGQESLSFYRFLPVGRQEFFASEPDAASFMTHFLSCFSGKPLTSKGLASLRVSCVAVQNAFCLLSSPICCSSRGYEIQIPATRPRNPTTPRQSSGPDPIFIPQGR